MNALIIDTANGKGGNMGFSQIELFSSKPAEPIVYDKNLDSDFCAKTAIGRTKVSTPLSILLDLKNSKMGVSYTTEKAALL